MKKSYITTPIYYVNDAPHIGHAYTSVMCDALARLKRLNGCEVKLLTGTDEHGQKVEKSALTRNKSPQEFCDEISQKFRDLADFLGISYSDFIRTTQDRHKKTAQIFWQKLNENGWIYKDVYEGWYAIRDEAFYGEDELVDGKAPSGAEVTWHKEESYFFRLGDFQDILLKIYEQFPEFINPKSKRNEVISFVKGGKELIKGSLKDLSISRTSFKWGIKVPDDENHIMYVWLDALTNYLSALNYPQGADFKEFWEDKSSIVTHIVGKDILRFHGVYWPAFLIGSKFKKSDLDSIKLEDLFGVLPDRIFAHGWWTNEGQKISKSLGNVIDPYLEIEWLKSMNIEEELAVEYFRYFLVREVIFGNDGNYSREVFMSKVNSELANNIGNLAQRTLSMIFKNSDGFIAKNPQIDSQGKELIDFGLEIENKISHLIESCDFDEILNLTVNFASKANEYLHHKAPWNLKKENKIDEMNDVLYVACEVIRQLAILLLPFTPNSAKKILDFLNIANEERNFANLSNHLKFGSKINEPKAVFARISELKQ